MCKFILLMAFIWFNPFNFPGWVITLAFIGLIADWIIGIIGLIVFKK